ncbi:hypothetical protein GLYMA_15G129950v4 [Glycine max]|nr:hypothetical protein GLYMA_15G129950v4 [Glycine max]KAH1146942.1 hypothetical protein GYH30_042214 [Glycine max]
MFKLFFLALFLILSFMKTSPKITSEYHVNYADNVHN